MNYKDNVKESMTATSTASFTPAGAAQNYQAFTAAYADGTSRIPVKVGPDSAGAWEVGYYTLSGGVLTRNGVISSSAGGTTPVTFASGSKDVTVVYPAAYAVDTENAVTLSNKRLQQRVLALTSTATPAVNTDNYDRMRITGLATAITSVTVSGTPVEGDSLTVDITDNGTSKNISWGTSFESSSIALPVATTSGQKMSIYLEWNPVTSKWRCVGVS